MTGKVEKGVDFGIDEDDVVTANSLNKHLETEVEPTALQFMKKCVSPNLPLIIREGCKYWPATSKWSHEYL
ncbi:hypothetical protein QYM36_002492, partial [Artemia franciscana]